MRKIILFRWICTQNKITELFAAPWETCHYTKLESLKIKNLKSFFQKRGINRKWNIWLNLPDLFFSELKRYLAKSFWKRLSVSLIFIFIIKGCIRQIKRQIQPCFLSGNVYIGNYISKFTFKLMRFMYIMP